MLVLVMQTFLPLQSYSESAKCLDYRRLGKQRVECLQILNVLLGGRSGWANHPAIKMWKDYEPSLVRYGQEVCKEWIGRGYKDTCLSKISSFSTSSPEIKPAWLSEQFCASHRSNLLRKDPAWYAKFGWTESPDMEYIWPTNT